MIGTVSACKLVGTDLGNLQPRKQDLKLKNEMEGLQESLVQTFHAEV
jgi:hypothetical protein